MTLRHSPVPWYLNFTYFDWKPVGWHVAGKAKGSTVPLFEHMEHTPLSDQTIADLQYAVHAASVHDELVAALEGQARLTCYYNGHGQDQDEPSPNNRHEPLWMHYLTKEARAALAKARGEAPVADS